MIKPTKATAIFFGDDTSMRVGQPWSTGTPSKSDPEITAVTISEDMPGPHCMLGRAKVWVGDVVVFEAPLHNLEGVEYPLEE